MTSKLRRMIAFTAARLLYFREETEYYRAKMKAARSVHKGWVKPKDLPSNGEIRDEVRALTRIYLGDKADEFLFDMRLEALHMMRILERFAPRLIGSVLTGHVRNGSDIDLHLFSNSIDSIRSDLSFHGYPCELIEKRVVKAGKRNVYRHLKVESKFLFELTVYPPSEKSTNFISSITGKPIEKASLKEFEAFMQNEYPVDSIERSMEDVINRLDPLDVFYSLLLPLEDVQQDKKHHPEGDALYHSLQVFDLACDQKPYDEEFLLAALLHDAGKGIDRFDHVQAGVETLEPYVTERTLWLVKFHMDAHKIVDRSIGSRLHKRLQQNPNYHDLLLLQSCDKLGRKQGVETSTLEEALEYLRDLNRMCH